MNAPEGKDPDGPGPGGAALERNDAGEEMGRSGDAGERTATEARYDVLEGKMKEDGFDIMRTPCGPLCRHALDFALGEDGDPHDEKAVKLALGVPGLDVNERNSGGVNRCLSSAAGEGAAMSSCSWPTRALM